MKIKTLILASSLVTSLTTLANDEIDYTWLEINYTNLQSDTFGSNYFITLDGSYAINDDFYLEADFSQVNESASSFSEDSYRFTLGFNKSIADKTDFYAELGYRWYDLHNNGGILATIGTRTILSDKVELITALDYQDYNVSGRGDYFDGLNAADEGFSLGVTALYKFNKNSSLHFGVKEKASNVSPTIGYRYSW
jgi:hypothetical protein